MNYIKKLKSLGFKKTEPIVICDFRYEKVGHKYVIGYYIKSLKEVENDEKYQKEKNYHPKSTKNQTYTLKVSKDVSLFLILIGGEFTFVIKNDSIPNDEKTNTIYINTVTIPIKSESLKENFWKRCMEFVSNDIKRDLLIKEIFKYG